MAIAKKPAMTWNSVKLYVPVSSFGTAGTKNYFGLDTKKGAANIKLNNTSKATIVIHSFLVDVQKAKRAASMAADIVDRAW